MEIKLKEISIRDLVVGYQNNDEEGVRAYSGKLDIRPPYQREFVYNAEEQQAVMQTVYKHFPLNVMYWAQRDDDTFEIIDGQQRTLSICEYVAGRFSAELGEVKDTRGFGNLKEDERERIYDYMLTVYICAGTDSEKLDWFRTINIAGKKLEDQELRNAVFAGSFVTAAKKKFSKTNCVAYQIGRRYLTGECNRQKYLETVIKWINNGDIVGYMQKHQHDDNADELWLYFKAVIDWVEAKFPKFRKEMKGIAWGELYNNHKDDALDAAKLEDEVSRLMADSDVQRKAGIYTYVLDKNHDERYLDIRAFDDNTRREVYEHQLGICPICGEHFAIEQMEADHITPWCQGGRTVADNCQMLCRDCNRKKGGK